MPNNPANSITQDFRQPENPPAKTEPLSAEEMDSFVWEKCVNKEAVSASVLSLIIRQNVNDVPDIQAAVQGLPDLWLLDKMPETAALLEEDSIETTESET